MTLVDSWRNSHLAEIMTGGVITIRSNASLYEAQKLLTGSKLTRIVVTDRSGKLEGIITRRDLVRFLTQDKTGRPLNAMRVKEAMTSPVVTLRPADTLGESARLMNKKGISSIVITDKKEQVLGIVTKTDLCFHYSLFPTNEKVSDYMTRKIFKVSPMHSIFLVSSILARHGISRVPVVDIKLRGMITLSDIVRTSPTMRPEFTQPSEQGEYSKSPLGAIAKLTAMTAADIMTPETITISPDEPLSHAADLMIEHRISGLPVIDSKGRVQGIITKTDIVRAIAARPPPLKPTPKPLG